MATVRVSTDLPIPAETACALAQKPATFQHVVRPLLRVTGLPERFEAAGEGEELSAFLWVLGVLPGWRHHLRIVELGPRELFTNERGGLVRRWDHRLTFAPLPDGRGCRYIDAVEIEAGLATPLVWLIAHGLYRYRQARWRGLARVLA